MNAPSPWLRPLQALAAVLGVALLVLGICWWNDPPTPLPAAAAAASGADATAPAPAPASAPAPPAADAQPTMQHRTEGAAAVDEVAAAAVLYGTVRGADGAPQKGGVFWLYRDGEHVGTQSLTDGTFAFAGLRPGRHLLRSRLDDQLPFTRDVDVQAPVTRVDLELPARWLLQVDAVTADGAPLLAAIQRQGRGSFRGLTAAAFEAPLAGDLPMTHQSTLETGIGTFRAVGFPFAREGKPLPKEALGVLTLPPDRPVSVALLWRSVVIAQQPATPGQAKVTFTLAPDAVFARGGKVRLRLVDAGGAPVPEAQVSLNDAQTGGGGRKTDAEGRIAFEHLAPGWLDLSVWHQTLRAPNVLIAVPPGADLDLGDVVAQPAVSVELLFDNFGGKGFVRMFLLDPPRPDWIADDLHFSAETASKQTVQVFPGRYSVLASGTAGVAMMLLDLTTRPRGRSASNSAAARSW